MMLIILLPDLSVKTPVSEQNVSGERISVDKYSYTESMKDLGILTKQCKRQGEEIASLREQLFTEKERYRTLRDRRESLLRDTIDAVRELVRVYDEE